MGVLVKDLSLPSQAGGPNDGAGGKLSEALGDGANEHITDILTGQVARQDGASGQVSGNILQGFEPSRSCMMQG